MKIVKHLTGILLLFSLSIQAQNSVQYKKIRALSIGDKMPDITIDRIQNYKSTKARFSDFKGKLVIIDFWFGACAGCIEAFPKMEALQKKFGDKLLVLMVNFESQQTIDANFRKYRFKSVNYRNPRLPSIVDDTIFHELFPHQYYPHEVWIDGKGIVKAFTEMTEVNEANIEAMIENRPVKMEMKMDKLFFNDEKAPILPQVYGDDHDLLRYYSAIMNYIPGVRGGWHREIIDSNSMTVRVSRRNCTIIELFTDALKPGVLNPFRGPEFDYGKRVVLNIKDSSKYFYLPGSKETKAEWEKRSLYTYEAVMPLKEEGKMQENIMHDLERFFNATCNVEKRKMKSLALVRTSNTDKIKTITGHARSVSDPTDPEKSVWQASTIQWFIGFISRANKSTPFVFKDETGYSGRIDIELSKNILTNIPLLRKELQRKYDLDLVEKECEVDVFVFTEKDH